MQQLPFTGQKVFCILLQHSLTPLPGGFYLLSASLLQMCLLLCFYVPGLFMKHELCGSVLLSALEELHLNQYGLSGE